MRYVSNNLEEKKPTNQIKKTHNNNKKIHNISKTVQCPTSK